ncbi:MAG: hypothetical protein ACOZAO_03120 [Patescibacteria group bacterium]
MEQPIPTNQDSDPVLNSAFTKKIRKQGLRLIGLFFLLVILALALNYASTRNSKNTQNHESAISQETQTAESTTNIVPESIPEQNEISAEEKANATEPLYISYLVPVDGKKFIYYVSNGDLWKLSLVEPYRKTLVLDATRDIIDFDVSPNENLIAYTFNTDIAPDNSDYYLNGVSIYNLETQQESEVWRAQDVTKHRNIRSIKFSPDGNQLFFTGNAIWVTPVSESNIQEWHYVEPNKFCGYYYIDDISPNLENILIRNGCYEGSEQWVIDYKTGEKVTTVSNGYIGGGIWLIGFIDDFNLLGYDNRTYLTDIDPETQKTLRLNTLNVGTEKLTPLEATINTLYFDSSILYTFNNDFYLINRWEDIYLAFNPNTEEVYTVDETTPILIVDNIADALWLSTLEQDTYTKIDAEYYGDIDVYTPRFKLY